MITITKQETSFHQSQDVVFLRITNSEGAYIEITNYGATITAIVIPDRHGRLDNVVLHYNRLTDYYNDPFYMGSTVGRYANRISNAEFTLDEKTCCLDINDGRNCIHGGFSGFSKKVFEYKINKNNVLFTLISPDGDGGFPGELKLDVIYSFSDKNELVVVYNVCASKRTVVNLTNHTYFNLAANNKDILDHHLRVKAGQYLESNNEFLPTGNILPVKNTAFDFNEYQLINKMISLKNDFLKGYNTYFINENDNLKTLATLWNKSSGRIVDVYTSMPGVLIYTGDYLAEPFSPFRGICLEAQYYPDGINNPHFKSSILSPYQEKTEIIGYRFGCVT